jgi:hypothetical protein
MVRDPNIIPKPIMKAMENFSDDRFISYVCKNHIKLFSNEILQIEISELKKYVDSLFSNFENDNKNIPPVKDENYFPDLSNVLVVVEKDSDYISAIKEVLWQLKNTPSTSKKILMHIAKIDSNGIYKLISEQDYSVTNKAFSLASFNGLLDCLRQPIINGKSVYLYKNPTDKRKGFYYKGNLLSLKELSKINNVPIVTIQSRLKKGIKIDLAIQ